MTALIGANRASPRIAAGRPHCDKLWLDGSIMISPCRSSPKMEPPFRYASRNRSHLALRFERTDRDNMVMARLHTAFLKGCMVNVPDKLVFGFQGTEQRDNAPSTIRFIFQEKSGSSIKKRNNKSSGLHGITCMRAIDFQHDERKKYDQLRLLDFSFISW